MEDIVKITLRMPRPRYSAMRIKLMQQGLTVQSLFDCLSQMYEDGDLPKEVTTRALTLQAERKYR